LEDRVRLFCLSYLGSELASTAPGSAFFSRRKVSRRPRKGRDSLPPGFLGSGDFFLSRDFFYRYPALILAVVFMREVFYASAVVQVDLCSPLSKLLGDVAFLLFIFCYTGDPCQLVTSSAPRVGFPRTCSLVLSPAERTSPF